MLERIKTMLELDSNDTDKDELLNQIISNAKMRLSNKIKLGTSEEIPEYLSYIVEEVAVIRFNRIASEGMDSESTDGHSVTFNGDEFKNYQSDIQDYLDKQLEDAGKKVKVVRFI